MRERTLETMTEKRDDASAIMDDRPSLYPQSSNGLIESINLETLCGTSSMLVSQITREIFVQIIIIII